MTLALPIALHLPLAARHELGAPVPQVVRRVRTPHLPERAGLELTADHGGAVALSQRFRSAPT